MEIYLIEIFIGKVLHTIHTDDNKKTTVNVAFGNLTSFDISQNEFDGEAKKKVTSEHDSISETDQDDSETPEGSDSIEFISKAPSLRCVDIRSGKSFLFPSYPDSFLEKMEHFPLAITVWIQAERRHKNCVGAAELVWPEEFVKMIRESAMTPGKMEQCTKKEILAIVSEDSSAKLAELDVLVRLTIFGGKIITPFQQYPPDVEAGRSFLFRGTDGISSYICQQYGEGPTNNDVMLIGALYESLNMRDPDDKDDADRIALILSDAVIDEKDILPVCNDDKIADPAPVKRLLKNIKLGQIKGPCGQISCPLASKVKQYLVRVEEYKSVCKSKPQTEEELKKATLAKCGCCDCDNLEYDELTHRRTCALRDSSTPEVNLKSNICDKSHRENEPKDRVNVVDTDTNTEVSDCFCGKPCDRPDCHCNEKSKKMFNHRRTCPYGNIDKYLVPPVRLEPCPVKYKPCTMGRTFDNSPPKYSLPKSYGPAGKICCKNELARVTKRMEYYSKIIEGTPERYCCKPSTMAGIPDPILSMEPKCCGKHMLT